MEKIEALENELCEVLLTLTCKKLKMEVGSLAFEKAFRLSAR